MSNTDTQWRLRPGVKMSPETAAEVAKIACALKSLSAYTDLVLEKEDNPEDLQKLVREGLVAMQHVFDF